MSEQYQFDDLTNADERWITSQRASAIELVRRYHDAAFEGRPDLSAIEQTYEAWLKKTALKIRFRPQADPNELVNALGVALGDLINEQTGMRWRIITDAWGTDLGLHTPGAGKYADVITHPTSFLAKRVTDRRSGWLRPTFENLIHDLLIMRDAPDE